MHDLPTNIAGKLTYSAAVMEGIQGGVAQCWGVFDIFPPRDDIVLVVLFGTNN